MALLTDDQDIRELYLHTEYGGNGDYYINLTEGDNRINFRVATSGGNTPTNVKLAIASLFRIMEDAGLNERPSNTVLENKQAGEQCFTKGIDSIIRDRFTMSDFEFINHINSRASQYATDRAKKLSDWKESAMKILSAVDDQEIGKLLGVPIGHSISENLLEKIKEYGDMRAKKALEKAAENAKVSYDPRKSSPYFVNKTSINNSKNLDV